MKAPRKDRDPAWMPVDYLVADIGAIQAMAKGEASAHQQMRALQWIIRVASGADELSFRSDRDGGERETAFAEGRRFVGLQIRKLAMMPGDVVKALAAKESGNG